MMWYHLREENIVKFYFHVNYMTIANNDPTCQICHLCEIYKVLPLKPPNLIPGGRFSQYRISTNGLFLNGTHLLYRKTIEIYPLHILNIMDTLMFCCEKN